MYAKIKITATLTVLTGLHIGASSGFSAIGAIDNAVIRDAYSGDPIIPGSSLKGKMRTLLARSEQGLYILNDCAKDSPVVLRLFGTPGDAEAKIDPHAARLQFSDAFLSNKEKLLKIGGTTEAKTENFITRSTSVANPRTTERVVRGAEFALVWYYTAEEEAEIPEDMQTFANACKLIQMDYLGGSGTRGYGRIRLSNFEFETVYGEEPACLPDVKKQFEDVSAYAAADL